MKELDWVGYSEVFTEIGFSPFNIYALILTMNFHGCLI